MGIKGLKEFINRLDRLKRDAENLSKQLQLNELLSPTFLGANSQFRSWSELEQTAIEVGFVLASVEDFKKIPDEDWDRFIADHSRFPSWQDMLNAAAAARVRAELGL